MTALPGQATPRLLALDTASGRCSVALLAGEQLVLRAAGTARGHAQLLLPMVDAVLAETGLTLPQLDGIAFGRGPGSFTGLRIAAGVTQGLAAGSGLPVLPVSDLRALALSAGATLAGPGPHWLLACMDARMGELYWGLFQGDGGFVGDAAGGERLSPPAALAAELGGLLPAGAVIAAAAGKGLAACPELGTRLELDAAHCLERAEPHAAQIARLAVRDLAAGASWLDAAAAQPVYLRDSVAQQPL
ncbi:MAG TPA: tRNA (adenosine(37)-N6)-threonylcarbamoyltransferase complex dimerization subunit type 1 TsaB [Steroidobacteraceae bacterium]|nr:tRNA (adenosine(37)-N6)-threonylcarbamoyltransferase complex dimerization subunit type 1 TsaB [Steroidobacteraceae bacterium]